MKVLTLALSVCLLASALFARKQRDWKTGTIVETAFAAQDVPVQLLSTGINGMTMAVAPRHITWQGYTIRGTDYVFIVAYPILRRNHRPNVAVNGLVRYAMEAGHFYLLDDDQREFELTVIQKTAPTPPPALF
jgi:hypothetical protein